MAVMTSAKFVEKCKDIAKNYKTLYVMGCFGAILSGDNVSRYCTNHSYNKQRERKQMIKAVANKGYFGFDCVGLIKSVLWGWNGDKTKTYGGAKYASNGVPDIDADTMITKCSGVSTNFDNIVVGEAVWCEGHIGVYIGDGLAIECTPSWANDVQITAVGNIGKKKGYNTRKWTKHGKLPYISYTTKTTEKKETTKKAETTKKETATTKTSIKEGSTVTIKKGAKYGGLSDTRGDKIPTAQLSPKKHTVADIQTNKGVKEALLKEIQSWVAVSSLTLVSSTTATTKAKTVKEGCKVKVKKGAKDYNGKSVADFVYTKVYKVDDLKGKRALLDEKGICTAFSTDDLIVQ